MSVLNGQWRTKHHSNVSSLKSKRAYCCNCLHRSLKCQSFLWCLGQITRSSISSCKFIWMALITTILVLVICHIQLTCHLSLGSIYRFLIGHQTNCFEKETNVGQDTINASFCPGKVMLLKSTKKLSWIYSFLIGQILEW